MFAKHSCHSLVNAICAGKGFELGSICCALAEGSEEGQLGGEVQS
jgi:hypothetical protein